MPNGNGSIRSASPLPPRSASAMDTRSPPPNNYLGRPLSPQVMRSQSPMPMQMQKSIPSDYPIPPQQYVNNSGVQQQYSQNAQTQRSTSAMLPSGPRSQSPMPNGQYSQNSLQQRSTPTTNGEVSEEARRKARPLTGFYPDGTKIGLPDRPQRKSQMITPAPNEQIPPLPMHVTSMSANTSYQNTNSYQNSMMPPMPSASTRRPSNDSSNQSTMMPPVPSSNMRRPNLDSSQAMNGYPRQADTQPPQGGPEMKRPRTDADRSQRGPPPAPAKELPQLQSEPSQRRARFAEDNVSMAQTSHQRPRPRNPPKPAVRSTSSPRSTLRRIRDQDFDADAPNRSALKDTSMETPAAATMRSSSPAPLGNHPEQNQCSTLMRQPSPLPQPSSGYYSQQPSGYGPPDADNQRSTIQRQPLSPAFQNTAPQSAEYAPEESERLRAASPLPRVSSPQSAAYPPQEPERLRATSPLPRTSSPQPVRSMTAPVQPSHVSQRPQRPRVDIPPAIIVNPSSMSPSSPSTRTLLENQPLAKKMISAPPRKSSLGPPTGWSSPGSPGIADYYTYDTSPTSSGPSIYGNARASVSASHLPQVDSPPRHQRKRSNTLTAADLEAIAPTEAEAVLQARSSTAKDGLVERKMPEISPMPRSIGRTPSYLRKRKSAAQSIIEALKMADPEGDDESNASEDDEPRSPYSKPSLQTVDEDTASESVAPSAGHMSIFAAMMSPIEGSQNRDGNPTRQTNLTSPVDEERTPRGFDSQRISTESTATSSAQSSRTESSFGDLGTQRNVRVSSKTSSLASEHKSIASSVVSSVPSPRQKVSSIPPGGRSDRSTISSTASSSLSAGSGEYESPMQSLRSSVASAESTSTGVSGLPADTLPTVSEEAELPEDDPVNPVSSAEDDSSYVGMPPPRSPLEFVREVPSPGSLPPVERAGPKPLPIITTESQAHSEDKNIVADGPLSPTHDGDDADQDFSTPLVSTIAPGMTSAAAGSQVSFLSDVVPAQSSQQAWVPQLQLPFEPASESSTDWFGNILSPEKKAPNVQLSIGQDSTDWFGGIFSPATPKTPAPPPVQYKAVVEERVVKGPVRRASSIDEEAEEEDDHLPDPVESGAPEYDTTVDDSFVTAASNAPDNDTPSQTESVSSHRLSEIEIPPFRSFDDDDDDEVDDEELRRIALTSPIDALSFEEHRSKSPALIGMLTKAVESPSLSSQYDENQNVIEDKTPVGGSSPQLSPSIVVHDSEKDVDREHKPEASHDLHSRPTEGARFEAATSSQVSEHEMNVQRTISSALPIDVSGETDDDGSVSTEFFSVPTSPRSISTFNGRDEEDDDEDLSELLALDASAAMPITPTNLRSFENMLDDPRPQTTQPKQTRSANLMPQDTASIGGVVDRDDEEANEGTPKMKVESLDSTPEGTPIIGGSNVAETRHALTIKAIPESIEEEDLLSPNRIDDYDSSSDRPMSYVSNVESVVSYDGDALHQTEDLLAEITASINPSAERSYEVLADNTPEQLMDKFDARDSIQSDATVRPHPGIEGSPTNRRHLNLESTRDIETEQQAQHPIEILMSPTSPKKPVGESTAPYHSQSYRESMSAIQDVEREIAILRQSTPENSPTMSRTALPPVEEPAVVVKSQPSPVLPQYSATSRLSRSQPPVPSPFHSEGVDSSMSSAPIVAAVPQQRAAPADAFHPPKHPHPPLDAFYETAQRPQVQSNNAAPPRQPPPVGVPDAPRLQRPPPDAFRAPRGAHPPLDAFYDGSQRSRPPPADAFLPPRSQERPPAPVNQASFSSVPSDAFYTPQSVDGRPPPPMDHPRTPADRPRPKRPTVTTANSNKTSGELALRSPTPSSASSEKSRARSDLSISLGTGPVEPPLPSPTPSNASSERARSAKRPELPPVNTGVNQPSHYMHNAAFSTDSSVATMSPADMQPPPRSTSSMANPVSRAQNRNTVRKSTWDANAGLPPRPQPKRKSSLPNTAPLGSLTTPIEAPAVPKFAVDPVQVNRSDDPVNDENFFDMEDRDTYGFLKGSRFVSLDAYDTFEAAYGPILERRKEKWDALFNECNIVIGPNGPSAMPGRSNKVKRYVRKGIPSEYRGMAWYLYSNAYDMHRRNGGLYNQLCEQIQAAQQQGRTAVAVDASEAIERDLHRTFPENIKFKATPKRRKGEETPTSASWQDLDTTKVPMLQSLRRVLLAFALYAPQIGYCQSLNYLAGLLLLFLDEEKAFWTMGALVLDILPGAAYYGPSMEASNVDQAVLMILLAERCPEIYDAIRKTTAAMGFDAVAAKEPGFRTGAAMSTASTLMPDGTPLPAISLITSGWFLTCFAGGALPIETALRVWDCVFYEGVTVLFRVGLTMLKIVGVDEVLPRMLSQGKPLDPLEVFQMIQNFPRKQLDCHTLMDLVFVKGKVKKGGDGEDDEIIPATDGKYLGGPNFVGVGPITVKEVERRRKIVRDKRAQFQQRLGNDGSTSSNRRTLLGLRKNKSDRSTPTSPTMKNSFV